MSAPAQPPIDALEAALTSLQGKLASIEAENESLKQQMAGGVLTDAQVAKLKGMEDAALGKSSGPSGS